MNCSWLTLRDIEYLLAVAKNSHFAKAAEACRVSQPALSTQIKKFEDRLGVKIFERDNRNVKITEKGAEILAQAQKIVDESSLLIEKAKMGSEPLSGPFRLGAIATIGPYFLPYVLAPLRKSYPRCQLFLEEGLTEGLLEKLSSGELDAVIAADSFQSERFEKHPLYFEPFLATVPKGHPFEKLRKISIKDLDAREMVLLEDGHCLSDQVLEICPKGKGMRRESFQSTSLETLRYLVASGVGYTLMPQLAVNEDKKLKGLITYVSFDKPVGRKVILVTRKIFSRKKDINTLLEVFKKSLPISLGAGCLS